MTFFDVGASFGVITLEGATLVGARGRVYAFEPMASTAAVLRDHLVLNGMASTVEVVEAVVAEAPGVVSFWEPDARSSNTTNMMASMSPTWVKQRHKRAGETETETRRDAVSIDEFCRESEVTPDVIKIDVEGAEGRVLRGASRFLAARTGHILMEIHPYALESLDESEASVLKLLDDSGWTYEEISRVMGESGEPSTRCVLCSPRASSASGPDQRSYAP
jgi:FkbM family methyltransferase